MAVPFIGMSFEAGKTPAVKMTYHAYVTDYWLPSLDVRQRTREGYESKMNLYVLPTLGRVPLDELSPLMVERWLSSMSGISARSRHHAFAVLRAALRQAVRWRLIDFDPTSNVTPPKVPPRRVQVATVDEARAIVEAFRGHRLFPVVVIAIAGGLRRSEAAALDWSDIDLVAGTVTVSKGLHRVKGAIITEPTKTTLSARTIPLIPWAIPELKAVRALGPLVPTRNGRMSPDTMSQTYKAVMKDAGLRYVPLRELRHTYVTMLLQAGVDPTTAARLAGHASPLMTLNVYSQPGVEALQAAVIRVDKVWKRSEKEQRRRDKTGEAGA
jgi:integrase